jgi:hypothetical protein
VCGFAEKDQRMNPTPEKLLSRAELAKRWACSTETIKRRQAEGALTALKFNSRTIRYRLSDILSFESSAASKRLERPALPKLKKEQPASPIEVARAAKSGRKIVRTPPEKPFPKWLLEIETLLTSLIVECMDQLALAVQNAEKTWENDRQLALQLKAERHGVVRKAKKENATLARQFELTMAETRKEFTEMLRESARTNAICLSRLQCGQSVIEKVREVVGNKGAKSETEVISEVFDLVHSADAAVCRDEPI